MDSSILLILLQDGIVNGAIYALIALSLVLVFTVTRVIFLPQGEFVTYGALTLAALEAGQIPGTAWLLPGLGILAGIKGIVDGRHTLSRRSVVLLLTETAALPLSILALTRWLAPLKLGLLFEALLALAIVTPMGSYLYRIAFRPLSSAPVLVLLIASVGVHLLMTGLGLIFFGAEGSRTSSLSDSSFSLGPLLITGQTAAILAMTLALMGSLYLFFGGTLSGKALRATAENRLGAQLAGISPSFAGSMAFTLAAFIGAISGILIAPITTIYYDTGFIIGLKGFVGAIIGGLASYPLAAAAAIFVGIVESLASFWASAFKEVIVFAVIIPVLLWRSWRTPVIEEGEDEDSTVLPRSRNVWIGRALLLFAATFIFSLPLLPGLAPFWITLFNYIGIYSIVTIGLVVLTGAGGITSFGQAMFAGLGAYATAVLTTRYGVSPWLSLPAALSITGFIAWLIGLVTLRLSGHYLPVATIAWNVSFFYIAANLDYLGRNDGLSGLPPVSIAGWKLLGSGEVYYLVWATAALAAILTGNFLNSRVGRAIRSLKGGVVAAESFGIDTARMKILAFVYAAMLASVSGWLYAHVQRTVSPAPFGLNASIEYLLMTVVGGAGYIWGAIAGSAIVSLIKDQLQNVLPRLAGAQLNLEAVVFGVALVLILQVARGGLWPQLAARVPGLGGQRAHPDPAAEPLARSNRGTSSGPILSVRKLRKTFGGLVAVDDLSFDVHAGEVLALIGPNGAGKTTAFNLITGVESCTGGEVLFNGARIERLPARTIARLGIARTFQHVKLVPGMPVIENVALGAHARGSAGALRAVFHLERAEEASLLHEAERQLRRAGLGDALHRPAVSLALGQQRIVEVARALCLDPLLLLLDEPAAGLRHLEKASLTALLRKLQSEGVAILLVEHDMDFVMGLADRVVVMNFGAKLAEGTPASIRGNPAVVEAYLGSVA